MRRLALAALALAALAAPGLAYRTHGDHRWPTFEARLTLDADLQDAARGAVRRAADDWSGVSDSGLRFVLDVAPDAGAQDHADRRSGVDWTDTLPDTTLGMTYYTDTSTGERLEADVLFNARHFQWSFDGAPAAGQQDLASCARHELGHALGLAHSELGCDDAVMANPCGVAGQVRPLREDDRRGVRHLYPAGAAPRLDWRVSGVACDPTTLAPGERVAVELTLREAGGAGASELPALRTLLGARDVSGPGDRVLADRPASPQAVAPGASLIVRQTLTVPGDAAPGDWWIIVLVDPADAVSERDETDNAGAAPLTLRAPAAPAARVDWQVVRVSATPDRVKKGERVTIGWEARNAGTATATSAPAVVLRASTNDTLSSADDLLASEPERAGSWGPGATLSGRHDLVPAWSGERHVGVVVDPDDRVPEPREDDNQATTRVVVSGCALAPSPASSSRAPLSLVAALALLAAARRRV